MSPKKEKTVEIMLGCPEDAECLRGAIEKGINEFNNQIGTQKGIRLKLLYWKDNGSTYSMPENVQKAINEQLCKRCTALIAVFYKEMGSANATLETGTREEIEYFRRNGKQAFILVYDGASAVRPSDEDALQRLYETSMFMKSKDIYYKKYSNEKDLEDLVFNELKAWQEEKQRSKSDHTKRTSIKKKDNHNELQILMSEHMMLCDEWNALRKYFRLSKKAEQLIDGIRKDGSVQYYVEAKERYRTTPTASVLEALYRAGLLPKSVCYKMQEWVYNSRMDPCDEPGEQRGKAGHEPNAEDMPGWSWNEGVSVWATSKALDTLRFTEYYSRADVGKNHEIQETTKKALEWLADQAYPSGGWGFQKLDSNIFPACAESVTMTALALRVITRFLKDSNGKKGCITLSDTLETKLSTAKEQGIKYLLNEMKADNNQCYWEYNGKKSLTATIWVLDFINVAGKNEAGNLYQYRKNIITFCLSELPQNEQAFDEYCDEVYFSGGRTKYKVIPPNSKFYSYMPYHIVTLLEAGVNPDAKPIVVCVHALIRGKNEYWNGTDKSQGHHQRQSSFVLAMALSTLTIWMKKMAQKQLSPKVKGEWNIE